MMHGIDDIIYNSEVCISALKIIRKRLEDNQIKWVLVGSTNMKLQGMETEPHDLDIVVQYKDLQKVSSIFSDYSSSAIMELKSLTSNPAWEVNTKINGIDVQFIAGEVPCFTLEAEMQTYNETKREHKAHSIQQYLTTIISLVKSYGRL